MKVAEIFEDALQTFTQKNEKYGTSWDKVGEIMKILFPNGIVVVTPYEHAKFHILNHIIGKIVRYGNTGGVEHIRDGGVYFFILEKLLQDGELK